MPRYPSDTALNPTPALDSAVQERGDLTYRKFFESTRELRFILRAVHDESGSIVDWEYLHGNTSGCAVYGWGSEVPPGVRLSHTASPREFAVRLAKSKDLLDTDEPWQFETRFGDRYFHVTIFRIDDATIAVTGLDITPRKRTEETLRESEERFREMADGLPFMLWVDDADGGPQFVNRTFCEFFGVTREQVHRDHWQMRIHPDDAAAYACEFTACIRERRPFHAECRVQNADGEWRWIESFGRPRYSVTGEFLGFVGTSPDITERKQADAALRESEARFRLAVGASPMSMSLMDRDYRFTWVYNPISGYRVEDVLGRTQYELLPPAAAEAFMAPRKQVFKTGQRLRTELCLPHADGLNRYWDTTLEPVTDAAGTVIGIISASLDITERRRAEEQIRLHNEELERLVTERTAQIQKLERQRLESERQVAVGRMAARIAHEINNPLAGVKNAFLLVKRGIPVDYPHYEFVGRIEQRD